MAIGLDAGSSTTARTGASSGGSGGAATTSPPAPLKTVDAPTEPALEGVDPPPPLTEDAQPPPVHGEKTDSTKVGETAAPAAIAFSASSSSAATRGSARTEGTNTPDCGERGAAQEGGAFGQVDIALRPPSNTLVGGRVSPGACGYSRRTSSMQDAAQ
jgi:hypothetical protein